MSAHRAAAARPRRSTRPRRGSGRTRAVLSLGAVAVLATGMSVQGTFAFYSDTATATTGSFTSGTFDVTLDGALVGNGGERTISGSLLDKMVPGESRAFAFTVANNGNVPLTYSLGGTGAGELNSAMQFSVYAGTTAAAGNGTTNGLRTGTCGGALVGAADRTLSATTTATPFVTVAAPRPLTAAGTGPTAAETVCVIAKLNPAADTTVQGRTMTASFVLDAKQVGA